MVKMIRAALYARFSSDIQKDRSIEDQFAELERTAERLGLNVDRRHYYADRGISATSLFDRPGLTRDLLGAAARHEFDAVLVEATDRLSRDRADMFWLDKRFKFYSVKIFTPSGEVSDIQLTFDGHINADFIAKLRMRVKRGHNALTREGKIAGARAYGYDAVPGQPGATTINEAEAEIVRRIFREYASGRTPRQIVAGLKADGIPSPMGRPVWNWQGIAGGTATGTGCGILHREIYRGRIVRNRFQNVKNPDTGKRLMRKAPADDVITVEAPHLRIVSEELWQAAHAVRRKRRAQMAPGLAEGAPRVMTRKQHLLSGLLRCASCSGSMTLVASNRGGVVACSNARHRHTCQHAKTYGLETITEEVIKQLKDGMTDPEFVRERMKARAMELAKAERDEGSERRSAQRRLDRLNVEISRLVDAIEDGSLPMDEIKPRIRAKEAERVALKERLRLLGDGSNVTTLQPSATSAFTKKVEALSGMLTINRNDPVARAAFVNLIDCVLVHPTPKKAAYELSLYARLSAVSNLELFPRQRTDQEILKDEGVNRLFETANNVTSSLAVSNNDERVILLRRWRAAA